MFKYLFILVFIFVASCSYQGGDNPSGLVLWYNQPAQNWNEALPVGNGRLGAMVFGSVPRERIQFNEETLWTGQPHDYSHPGAAQYLDTIRNLVFQGDPREAERMGMDHFMSIPLGQKAYQPFGDLYLTFPGHENYSHYRRSLDLNSAINLTRYEVNGITFSREIFSSHPGEVIVVRIKASQQKALSFEIQLDSPHELKNVVAGEDNLQMTVRVKNGVLYGIARLSLETDGTVSIQNSSMKIDDAAEATLYLTAATNFENYKAVNAVPAKRIEDYTKCFEGKSFNQIKKEHIADYQSLFKRFDIGFGESDRDTLPMDERLGLFNKSPEDPELIALYVQYGRYLMISSSRPGTQPANLQGIWNQDLQPAWESKYTTNINAEMNYWPAEVTNLSECHEPFFRLIEECAQTGTVTAKVHYNADGWVLHHNTDIWRGTAPINHSNHGIWLGGSGWTTMHLWEHFLFTRDTLFLREKAWPVMREAARFYAQNLIPDPKTGWLISTPSNSPEIGGLVAGPTMDHQIIRSLFKACVQTSEILRADHEFAEELKALIPEIAPNQTGRLGQLQEWMEDVDNPDVKHRHVSHLWGMHPGDDITWEKSPELMQAARQSLLFRGDDGTGWSLAWKINFWARFLEGDRAYDLIRMLLRIKEEANVNWSGGSYINLFDAHPPFQIDGNFGGAAGIVELLVQSHQGFIELLPALPSAMPDGYIKGVCARGGFELDMKWKDGNLEELTVLSKAGMPCKLKYDGEEYTFDTRKGELYVWGKNF